MCDSWVITKVVHALCARPSVYHDLACEGCFAMCVIDMVGMIYLYTYISCVLTEVSSTSCLCLSSTSCLWKERCLFFFIIIIKGTPRVFTILDMFSDDDKKKGKEGKKGSREQGEEAVYWLHWAQFRKDGRPPPSRSFHPRRRRPGVGFFFFFFYTLCLIWNSTYIHIRCM